MCKVKVTGYKEKTCCELQVNEFIKVYQT